MNAPREGGDDSASRERSAADRAALAVAPGMLLAGVAGGIAFPILPIVGAKAGLSLALIGAILAANRVGRIVASPVVGVLADRLGGRRLLLAGLFLQVAIMGLYALGVTTGNPGVYFLLGRALHGPGSAGVYVAGQALALHAGGKRHGGVAAGTVRAAISVGLPLGLVAGGLLSVRFGFAATFEIAMVAIAAAFVAAFFLVPDVRASIAKPVPIAVAFGVVRDRRIAALGALNFAVSFLAQGLVLTTLVLVVDARKLSVFDLGVQMTASIAMGFMVVVMGAATLLASRLATGPRAHARIAAFATALLVPALVVMGLFPGAGGLFIGLGLIGLGAGALASSLLALIGELVDVERRGAAVGFLQLTSDVGGSMGPVVGSVLLGEGASTPYLVSAGALACFVPVGIWLARQFPRGARESDSDDSPQA